MKEQDQDNRLGNGFSGTKVMVQQSGGYIVVRRGIPRIWNRAYLYTSKKYVMFRWSLLERVEVVLFCRLS
jgi:hypothetical protein